VAVVLRLARHGTNNRPYYRIVATEKTAKRDGRFIEQIGTYNPKVNPPVFTLREDKVKHWVGLGARPSQLVRDLIVKQIPGFIEEREKHQLAKLQAARKKRKTRAAKSKSK